MTNHLKHNLLDLILLACGMVLLASCQGRENATVEDHDRCFRPVRMLYENSSGESAITSYFYDTHGRNYMARWQLEDSSRSSINYYEFDTSGNLVRKYREFSDGLISDQHFFYDGSGRLAGEDYYRSDSVEGRTDYEYGEGGRCLAARCKGLNGWFYGDLLFYYDSEGRKKGAGIYRAPDSIGFILYNYDDAGNLTREYWDLNGQWSQSFVYEYQKGALRTCTSSSVFISENRWFRIREEHYTYLGGTGGISHYQYDDEGRLTGKEFLRSDGLSTRTTYQYDSTGILRSSHKEYPEGITADFHYWYSIDRKLLVRTFERSDGGRGSETYRYDDQGLLVSGDWENFDDWLTGKLTFSHEEKGLLKTGTFRGDDDFDADLSFEYDLNQNLTAINWEFSYGGCQKYSFTYEPL
jgi:hypothetical protein